MAANTQLVLSKCHSDPGEPGTPTARKLRQETKAGNGDSLKPCRELEVYPPKRQLSLGKPQDSRATGKCSCCKQEDMSLTPRILVGKLGWCHVLVIPELGNQM